MAAGLYPASFRLTLLSGFELTSSGRRVDVPMSAQRLLAFLAFQDRPLLRPHVAGTLWPDTVDARASANLRSSLWRINRSAPVVIDASGQHLQLAGCVEVDVRQMTMLASRISQEASSASSDMESAQILLESSGDLLPDWYEDWVHFKREQLRQVRLHALEALCARLTKVGRHATAVQAGLAAVESEPLRETAHRVLIRAYMAEGNQGEALQQYDAYRKLLLEELGLKPSSQMESLVDELRAGPMTLR